MQRFKKWLQRCRNKRRWRKCLNDYWDLDPDYKKMAVFMGCGPEQLREDNWFGDENFDGKPRTKKER